MSGSYNIPAELTWLEALTAQGELFTVSGEITVAAGASYKMGLQSPENIVFLPSKFRTAAAKARVYI